MRNRKYSVKKKRLHAIILSASMLAALISACSSSESSSSGTAAPISEASTEVTAAVDVAATTAVTDPTTTEPVNDVAETEKAPVETPAKTEYFPLNETKTLSVWNTYIPPIATLIGDSSDIPTYKAAAEAMNIEYSFIDAPFTAAAESLSLLIASSEYPDIFMNMSIYYTGGLELAIEENVIIDLRQIVLEYAPNFVEAYSANDLYLKAMLTDSGLLPAFYGFTDIEASATISKSGPVVRQDWLDQTGLELPTTYDEYHEVLMAFQTLGCEHPFWLPYTGAYRGGTYATGYGIAGAGSDSFYQVDGVVHYSILEDGYREYIQMLADWYSENLIDPDFISYTESDGSPQSSQIINNEIGVWSEAATLMSYSNIIEPGSEFKLSATTNPVKNSGDKIPFGDTTSFLGATAVISTDCKDVELAARWCDWWYSDEGYMLANYGIEDVSYVLDSDGNAKYTDVILNPEDGLSTNIVQSLYTVGNGQLICVQDPYRTYQWYEDYQIEAEKLWATVETREQLMPTGVAKTSEEGERYSSRYNDIATYLSENSVKFIRGERSMSEFDGFISTLYELGVEECIDINQAALNRFYNR